MTEDHYREREEHEEGVGALVPVANMQQVAALNASEIDMQVTTARRYPRELSVFRKGLISCATIDGAVAQACVYSLPRAGKNIVGPSIRFAEIVQSEWTNMRTGANVLYAEDEFIVARGFAFDLQRNSATSVEIKRRITNREGKRFDTDMIGVTGNAACSIAKRNAILAVVPKAYWEEGYMKAREVIAGSLATLATRRMEAVKFFTAEGVKPDAIFGVLGVRGLDDILLEHLIVLGGIRTAIKEKTLTLADAFHPDNFKAPPGEAGAAAPQRVDFKEPKAKRTKAKAEPAKDAQPNPKDEPKTQPAQAETQSTGTPETASQVNQAPELPEQTMFPAPPKCDADWWKADVLGKIYGLKFLNSLREVAADLAKELAGNDEAVRLVGLAADIQAKRIEITDAAAKAKAGKK